MCKSVRDMPLPCLIGMKNLPTFTASAASEAGTVQPKTDFPFSGCFMFGGAFTSLRLRLRQLECCRTVAQVSGVLPIGRYFLQIPAEIIPIQRVKQEGKW